MCIPLERKRFFRFLYFCIISIGCWVIVGQPAYWYYLDEYDFTFDIDDDGMINGSGLGYSECGGLG
uniref:Uncharacterized protein n=1 Tax=Candidatus Methanophaga sp. ANME-1 ERB7 TaxID=2759913 RepID=A0A7G9ZD97_9EURY|nr:hypothetical protein DKLEMCON_00013 [Methanosarcinales archaeon ANME-1 ERB7]